jgi:hypothetical protein
MFKKLLLPLLISIFLFSCEKTEEMTLNNQLIGIEKGEITNDPNSNSNPSLNIVYIYDNNVYLIKEWDEKPTKLTNYSGSWERVYNVRISPDKKYVAYLDNSGTPIIIEVRSKKVIKTGDDSYCTDIQWQSDSKALVVLNNDQFTQLTIGTTNFTAPNINFISISVNNLDASINSFDLTKDGGIVYYYSYKTYSYSYSDYLYYSVVKFKKSYNSNEVVLISDYKYSTPATAYGININNESDALNLIYSDNSNLYTLDFGTSSYSSSNYITSSIQLTYDYYRNKNQLNSSTKSYNFNGVRYFIDKGYIYRILSDGSKSIYYGDNYGAYVSSLNVN